MTAPKGNEDHTARIIAGVPEGLDALVLAQLVNEAGSDKAPGTLLHVARDDRRLERTVLDARRRCVPPRRERPGTSADAPAGSSAHRRRTITARSVDRVGLVKTIG